MWLRYEVCQDIELSLLIGSKRKPQKKTTETENCAMASLKSTEFLWYFIDEVMMRWWANQKSFKATKSFTHLGNGRYSVWEMTLFPRRRRTTMRDRSLRESGWLRRCCRNCSWGQICPVASKGCGAIILRTACPPRTPETISMRNKRLSFLQQTFVELKNNANGAKFFFLHKTSALLIVKKKTFLRFFKSLPSCTQSKWYLHENEILCPGILYHYSTWYSTYLISDSRCTQELFQQRLTHETYSYIYI